MEPKDLKLPNIKGEVAGLPAAADRIWKILWAVDPAHLSKLDPRVIERITLVNIDYRAKMARLDAQASQMEAESLEALSKALSSHK